MVPEILQCGRIYKDAEIFNGIEGSSPPACTFNVAASIKMRKSRRGCLRRSALLTLQCGRIYKDAEIELVPRRYCASLVHLQCGRIYKDAEIPARMPSAKCPSNPSMWPHL